MKLKKKKELKKLSKEALIAYTAKAEKKMKKFVLGLNDLWEKKLGRKYIERTGNKTVKPLGKKLEIG